MWNQWVEHILYVYAQYPMIGILLALQIIDVITGMLVGITEQRLSSKISFTGMCRKVGTLILVGVAAIIEYATKVSAFNAFVATVQVTADASPDVARDAAIIVLPLAKITAGFFSWHECLSILENAKRMGVPIPPFLSKGMATLYRETPTAPNVVQNVIIESPTETETRVKQDKEEGKHARG